jgi:hypothetical protein
MPDSDKHHAAGFTFLFRHLENLGGFRDFLADPQILVKRQLTAGPHPPLQGNRR